jgi:cytochrome bd-type quinol oxidase subunit 1
VDNGDATFTLIGFVGLYFVIGLAFLYLVGRELDRGPDWQKAEQPTNAGAQVTV